MRLEGCHALITGASAGIGREFARQLAGRAATLLLVARRQNRLEELSAELRAKHPRLRVEIRRTDLSQSDEVDALIGWATAQMPMLDLLVNNAGLGDLGAFATAEPERIDQIMRVNMIALTRLTRGLLSGMIAQKRGAILNVSSSASFLPIANFAVYAATKAYVTSLSEALRSELRGHGIEVTALCPGPVATEFMEMAHRKGGAQDTAPDFVYVPVERVVTDALRGLEARKAIVIPGWAMKLGMTIVRLTPLALLRLASRFSAKPA